MASFRTRDIFNGRYFQKAARFTIPLENELDGRMVEKEIFEAVISRHPDDIEALTRLGHLYTELGDYQRGLETDLKLTALCPDDALAWYNRACSHALLLQEEEGVTALERSADLQTFRAGKRYSGR